MISVSTQREVSVVKPVKYPNNRKIQNFYYGMMRRCYEPKRHNYRLYGGRGITVCKEWHSYSVFRAWAYSNGWQHGLQLDRIDNNQGYSPNNCRFVRPKINANNRNDNVRYIYSAGFRTAREIADIEGITWHQAWRMAKRYLIQL